MEYPDMDAKAMPISRAQRAAAKELVTPSTPESLVRRISLIATEQEAMSMVVLVLSTRRCLRQTEEWVSLSKLAMVASELFLKTMQRKVKMVPQSSQRVACQLTQELSAVSDIPGPFTYSPQRALLMVPTSLTKLLAVQVILQMAERESPQSMSSRLMLAHEKMFMQASKLLIQAELLKLASQMSQPRSTEQQLAKSQKILYMAAVSVGSFDKSLMQVMFPPQSALLQSYLYPFGTWKKQANMLEYLPSKRDMFSRDRKMGSFTQGMTYGRERERPTALVYGGEVHRGEDRLGRSRPQEKQDQQCSQACETHAIVQILCRKQGRKDRCPMVASSMHSKPTIPLLPFSALHSIHNYRTLMANNDSSSLCNLTLEEGDLRKLEELDPFQTEGFQSLARVPLSVSIVYTSETGKETRDIQPVTLQLLTRWLKPQPSKGKEVKSEPHLDCLKVYISSEEDIFLSMVSNLTASSFEALKTKNQLNLQFKDFPNSLLGMLRNCGSGQGQNSAELQLSFQGTGRLLVRQHTEYKEIELAELHFTANSLEKAHQSIIFRHNYNRTKLAMLEHSIEAVYALLAAKNPPLLAYIQKTVGN